MDEIICPHCGYNLAIFDRKLERESRFLSFSVFKCIACHRETEIMTVKILKKEEGNHAKNRASMVRTRRNP